MDRLTQALVRPTAWLFIAATLISAYEVVMRYAFNSPSTWVHVVATTLCAVAFALGGAWSMTRNEHIRITLLPDRASAGGKRAIEIVSLLTGIVYLAGLAWGLWLQARESVVRFNGADWAPELTPGPPHLPLPSLLKVTLLVGTLLFFAVVVAHFIRLLRDAGPRT
ncbi:MAG: TRAP transporter small permease subunit [Hyphomicrobiales bacterium]|nr:TRAP transporter small permease subunit [Hyphomicrobiales bacterium]